MGLVSLSPPTRVVPGSMEAVTHPKPITLASLDNPTVLEFPTVTGTVSGWAAAGGFNGPNGGPYWGGVTNVPAYGGISGIEDSHATMFLVGVFLGPNGQPQTAPASLDVSNANSAASTSPLIGQQFFIGNGQTKMKTLQEFDVPAGATSLYLGFAENFEFSHHDRLPGFYTDNGGKLSVDVEAADVGLDSARINGSTVNLTYHTIGNPGSFTVGFYQSVTPTYYPSGATYVGGQLVTQGCEFNGHRSHPRELHAQPVQALSTGRR